MEARVPDDETARLAELVSHQILDTAPEAHFDETVQLVATTLGVDIGAITLIDRERQWVKALAGDMPRELPRREAFCAHTILEPELLCVPDALLDPRFADSPLVHGAPFIRFYAGVPLRTRDGLALGALCVIHHEPRVLAAGAGALLRALAHGVEAHLQVRLLSLRLAERLCRLEQLERQRGELAAFLAHDLRGPLTTVLAGTHVALRHPGLGQRERAALREASLAAEQVARMAGDLVDVSHAEDGALVPRRAPFDVVALAEQVVGAAALRASEEGQRVELVHDDGERALVGDATLVRRVLENLVDNALRHGPSGQPVRLELRLADAAAVELCVCDRGAGVPPAQRQRIFEKFVRLADGGPGARRGHGLGLTFCRLAVEAHGGTIHVEDAVPHGACFVARLPRRPV